MSLCYRTQQRVCNDARCEFQSGSARAIVVRSHGCCHSIGKHNGNDIKGYLPLRRFQGREPQIYEHLQPFGRVGYVTKHTKIRKKFTKKSTKCICLGNAKNHVADVYRVYDTVTKSTKFSRDIKWADWHGGQSPTGKIKQIEMPTVARLK